jgi:hypothetical protein
LLERSGGGPRSNCLDPSQNVRLLQQTLRLQKLADFHHRAMHERIGDNGTKKGGFELLSLLEVLRAFAAR